MRCPDCRQRLIRSDVPGFLRCPNTDCWRYDGPLPRSPRAEAAYQAWRADVRRLSARAAVSPQEVG
jgi:hypothetical protein